MTHILLAWILLCAQDESPAAKVAGLAAGLASSDAGAVDRAFVELERTCFQAGRPGAEAERKAVAQALAAQLEGGVPVAARVLVLRLLETCGRGEVVPAISKLLRPENDAGLREGARRALEANPHPNAKRELRAALRTADGALRIGIARSLGVRRDFLAAADLIEVAEEKGNEPAVRLAALEALAEIGDVSAVSVVEAALQELKGPELAAAQRAYLRLADSLARQNERGAARRIYEKALSMGPAPRAAALLGFARAGLQMEVERVAGAIDDPDPRVRGAAIEAAAAFPGEAMTKLLVARLAAGGGPEGRSALLELLARRGGPDAAAAVLRSARDRKDPGGLRAAALRQLRGGLVEAVRKEALEALLEAIDAGGEPAAAAEEALADLPGAAEALVQGLADPTGTKRAALIRAAAAQRDARALEAVRAAAKDPLPAVRLAALRALGRLGSAAVVPDLVAALRSAEPAERDAAERSLGLLGGEEASVAVLAAARAEVGPRRAALLRVAGSRAPAAASDLLREAARDPDPAVRVAALDGLARSSDPAALPVLLEALEKGSAEERQAAARGALRFAEALASKDRDRAARLYEQVLGASGREDDLRGALRGLAEVGPPGALEKIRSFLKPGALQRAAGRAALRLAERLPEGQQAGARSIYERILELDVDEATATQCVRRLRRLGVEADFARKAGFVTRWWILAPFPNPQGELWDKALPPESGVDLASPVLHEGEERRWKPYHTPSPRGLVALEEAGYPQSSAGAYLYAEVTGKAACDAVLKIGSDDQVACWLNGEKVHANKVNRGLAPDQDSVEVRLREGANRILLKVLNDGGGWGACLRITGRDGKPLELEQARP
ncbi:MAG: HEAT repeat domain-containing protein [Planctomycetes bacterium]|nr:HEAT repeat domain-containing protein [Planctomycetota bacterium]